MEIEAQIRVARLQAVFDRLAVTLAITVVNGTAVAAVLAAGGAGWRVWGWLGLVLALSAARLAALAAYRRDAALSRMELWEAVAVGGALASGLLWGLGAALLSAADAASAGMLVGQVVLVLLLGAMCAGAATVQAVHTPTALAFIVPACVPLAVRLALNADGRHLAMAAMVLLYAAVLVVVARRSARQFDDTVRLQIALAQRTKELDDANARLRTEIEGHRPASESQRLGQRMEVIGQLTGGVAHDLNNVLSIIGGNLQLIGKKAEGHADIQRHASSAERAAERGARLAASLLSFSREQMLRPQEIDLTGLVRESAPLLRRALDGRMELVLELPPGELPALVDPAQFQVALMHLLISARDAGPPGRRLTIATSLATAGETAPGPGGMAHPGPFACVTVRDTGPANSPEAMSPDAMSAGAARAFEPFFTSRDAGKGIGLGLSQVYGFARQSGGTAREEVVAGGGAAVSILLPAPVAAVGVKAVDAQESDGAGRVLLVEDDPDVREVLQESLSASGWQVTPAATGGAARAVLEGGAGIDIVVSDVVMPGEVSGVDLARMTRSLRPDVPVLLISGYPTATLAAHGVDESELNLLRKPFTHAELLARMQQVRRLGTLQRAEARACGG